MQQSRLDIEILTAIEKKLTVLVLLKNKKIFIGKFSNRNALDAINIRHQSTLIFQLMSVAKHCDNDFFKLIDYKDEYHHNNENDLYFTINKDDIESVGFCNTSDSLNKILNKMKEKVENKK